MHHLPHMKQPGRAQGTRPCSASLRGVKSHCVQTGLLAPVRCQRHIHGPGALGRAWLLLQREGHGLSALAGDTPSQKDPHLAGACSPLRAPRHHRTRKCPSNPPPLGGFDSEPQVSLLDCLPLPLLQFPRFPLQSRPSAPFSAFYSTRLTALQSHMPSFPFHHPVANGLLTP